MKKTLKRLFASLMVVVMVLTAAPLSGFVGLELPDFSAMFYLSGKAASGSGVCGDNLTWSLSRGGLTITGEGEMYDYTGWNGDNPAPWTLNFSRGDVYNIYIGEGVTSIGAGAISGLYNLDAVYVPKSIRKIKCGITSVGLAYRGDIDSWCSIELGEYCGFTGSTLYINDQKVTNLVIPGTVEKVNSRVFYGFENYFNLTFSEGVKEIGKAAFSGGRFSNVRIANTIETIGEEAFRSAKIGVIDLGSNVKNIEKGAFKGCEGLKNVTLPDSVVNLGENAFYDCEDIETVSIGKSIGTLSNGVFENCTNLKSISIPDNVKKIGDSAFSWCYRLEELSLGNSIKEIGERAFFSCNFERVSLPDTLEKLGYYAFYDCENLKCFEISSENKYFDVDESGVLYNEGKTILIQCPPAFGVDIDSVRGCDYVIPDTVEHISSPGFRDCEYLRSVTIPYTTMKIDESAFSSCKRFTDVYYLETEESWDCIDIGANNEELLEARIHYVGGALNFERKNIFIGENKYFLISGEIFVDLSDSKNYDLTFSVSDETGLEIVSENWSKIDNLSGKFNVTVKGLKEGEYILTVSDGFNKGTCKVIVGFNELHIEFEDLMDNLYSLNGFFFDENGNYFAGALDVIVKLNNRARAEYFFDSFTQKEMESAAFNVKFTMEVNEGFSFDGAGTRYVEYVYEPLEFRKTEEIEAKIYQEDESVKNLTVTYNAYIDDELKHTDTETTTIKSYQEQYADEHINTIYSNTGYHTILNYGFAQGMIPLEDSYDYKFYKFLSDGLVGSGVNMLTELDEKMAYDLVIADIVNGMYSKETIEEASVTIFSEEFTDIVKKVFEITVETAKEIPEAKEKLNKVLLKDFVKMFNGEVSQDAIELFKLTLNDKTGQEKMKALMSKVSKVDSVLTMLNRAGLFLDTYNDYIQATNAIAAMNTFSQMDDTLIAVFNAMYGYSYNNTALQASLKTYLTYMNDTKADRIFRILSAYVANSADTTTKAVLMLVNGIFAEEIKKIVAHPLGKIIKGIGSVISSIELGIYLTSALTNADNYSESVGKVIVAGKLSEVLEKAISELGKNVKNTKSFSNAIILDRGLYLYREIEKYAYTHTIEALEAEYTNALGLDPLTILIWGDKSDEYNKKIIELMIESASLDFLYCHDLNLEKIASQIMSLPTSASSNRKTIPAFKVINVRCPVDVSVYNGKTLVAKFTGDKLEYAADGIVALAYYDEKYICLPSTSDFDIEIKAREEGEMNYSVFEYDESGEFSREISYEDIELSENQKFTGVINDEALTDKGNYDLSTNGDKISDCKDSMDGYDFSEDVSIKVVGNKDVGLNSSTIYRILGSNLPENAKVNWSCSDKSVVLKPTESTLSCEVIAGKTGKFTLTVTLEGSNLWDETEITVTEKQYNLKWFIAGSCITQTYSYGEKIVLPEISIPEEYDFVKWSSEIPETMPAHDVNIIAVLNAKSGKVHSVSIDDISMSYKDSATVAPSINVDSGVNYTVTYSSSNTDVVSVDSNGRLTTNDKGSATITVTVTDEYGNTVSDTCEVNVKYKWWQWIIVIVLFGWIWY